MNLSTAAARKAVSRLPEMDRLYWLEKMSGESVHSAINERAAYAAAIARCAKNGVVGIFVSSTDCDWTHAKYAQVLPVAEVPSYIERLYAEAEGPTSYSIITPEEANAFEGESRDLALEAFEAGHPHCIHA